MIHKFSMDGVNIVLDIYSGAVHVVDDIVYDLVDDYQKYSKDELIQRYKEKYDVSQIEEAIEEIEALENEGLLYTEDMYVDYLGQFQARNPIVKALCLHIAHDCNLKCKYCFAGEGEYRGQRSLMSAEVGKKAIDFLIQASGNRRNLEIDFFGGEPLMNFEVVKEIVDYARSIEGKHNKNFRFTITTNGVLLDDDIQAYINEHMHNVVLSIDGRKEVHDRMRYTINHKGSYDLVVPKFKKIADSRNQTNYYVRGTFTRENLDFAKDVLHLADIGFKQVSVEPVVAPKEMSYALREEDLPMLYEQYEELAKELVKRKKEGQGFNFFHFMIDLSQGPCVAKRLAGCGSGSEYLAVTPEGDLYPCHQFVGLEEFKMGTVFDGIQNQPMQKQFQACNVYAKDECKNCWAKFYCSGGCAANAYQFHGDIHKPYKIGCELEKKRVECALYVKAKLAE
ncbi:thioether cross-link-forming SCIFF peptide maturase [Defluviitalea raffinosedens]|uniref:Thioether cross-link-forming SCIFF peptide maturase n=1 Tax=Defluviitalea raffinosedens TaxID=1450156 RepID=A0A7C8HGQ5_9FIRM|nr:thioether cross-link-forming SCIFF peptide maturase [Defluviitalea raffinosedens]KAE9634434.1 thioether cross-link-forming SCIFF peptide maturase [Defluviitalea raffinosedens]